LESARVHPVDRLLHGEHLRASARGAAGRSATPSLPRAGRGGRRALLSAAAAASTAARSAFCSASASPSARQAAAAAAAAAVDGAVACARGCGSVGGRSGLVGALRHKTSGRGGRADGRAIACREPAAGDEAFPAPRAMLQRAILTGGSLSGGLFSIDLDSGRSGPAAGCKRRVGPFCSGLLESQLPLHVFGEEPRWCERRGWRDRRDAHHPLGLKTGGYHLHVSVHARAEDIGAHSPT
jgi:hypothetical protein